MSILGTRRAVRRAALGAYLAAILVLSISLTAAADTGTVFVSNDYESQFADHLTFRLEVESDVPIVRTTLRYRREGSPLTTRVEVPVSSGMHVLAEHVKRMERGEIPPGTALTYSWTVADETGKEHSTEPVTFVCEDDRFAWEILHADGIAIHWYEDESNARALLVAGAEASHRLQDEMGISVEKSIKVFVYQTSSDMRPAVAARSEGYDARVVTLGMVVSDDTMLLLGSHRDAEETIAHELSHLVVGLATKNPYADLPRWLDEGLAMYAQGEVSTRNQAALERAIREDSLISVRSLSGYTGDPAEVDLYYGEVYSLIDYLIGTYGKGRMTELLTIFSQGSRQEDALKQVYGFGLDELDTRWRASLSLAPRGETEPASDRGAPPEPSPTTCGSIPLLSMMGILGALRLSRQWA